VKYIVDYVEKIEQMPKQGTYFDIPGYLCAKKDKLRKMCNISISSVLQPLHGKIIADLTNGIEFLFFPGKYASIDGTMYRRSQNPEYLESNLICEGYSSEKICDETQNYTFIAKYSCSHSSKVSENIRAFYESKCKIISHIQSKEICKISEISNERATKVKCIPNTRLNQNDKWLLQ